MPRSTSLRTSRNGCEPEILVKMALELDCVGPAVFTAVDEMLTRHQLPELAALLQASAAYRLGGGALALRGDAHAAGS